MFQASRSRQAVDTSRSERSKRTDVLLKHRRARTDKHRALTKKNTPPVTLVVKRGALRRFDRLKQATRELDAEVIWDRRASDRGTGAQAEPSKNRRKAMPSTWDLADFVVSEPESASNGSRSRKP